ncbi:bifunctional DNA primase/polymerase, partial [Amycolatopsis sp. cmx-4-61]|uniref:bifunctional DNA primase/polymerase n=1 Tax=Amycolatopsis sp. cmx-4-61 TaxID=2790937 RepID=UPI00397B541B
MTTSTRRRTTRPRTGSARTRLDAALAAARRGWPVFPVFPYSKYPTVDDWENRATCDENQLADWWKTAAYNLLTGLRSDTPKWTLSWMPSTCRTSATSSLGGCVGVLSGAD